MLELGSEKKIAIAGLGGRITLAQLDVKALDLPDAAFDAVFSNTILHHIPEPAAMLRRGGARPQAGRPAADPRPASGRTRLEAQLTSAWSINTPPDCDAEQRRLFAESLHAALTPDELRELAKANGLGEAEVVIDTDRHMSLQRAID